MGTIDKRFVTTALGMVGFAILPFPGRWKLLQQIVPMAIVGIYYVRQRYSGERAGLGRPSQGWGFCVLQALALAIGLYIVEALTIGRLAATLFDGKDLSLFEPIQGSLPNLLIYLIFMWLMAAFGEEFIWRGFLLREIGERRLTSRPWMSAILTSALFFGLAHAYQGPFGVFEKSLSAIVIGSIYFWSGRLSIWLVVLIHGFQNTISFVAIYFGVYDQVNFSAL